VRGRTAIAARGNGGGVEVLRCMGPHNLNGGKSSLRQHQVRRRHHGACLHQLAAKTFVLLVLRFAGKDFTVGAGEEHAPASAEGDFSVLREREPPNGTKLRKRKGAGEDVEKENKNAERSYSFAPKRAATPAWPSVSQPCPQCLAPSAQEA